MTLEELKEVKELINLSARVSYLGEFGSTGEYKTKSKELQNRIDAISDTACNHDWQIHLTNSATVFNVGDCKICGTRRIFEKQKQEAKQND